MVFVNRSGVDIVSIVKDVRGFYQYELFYYDPVEVIDDGRFETYR